MDVIDPQKCIEAAELAVVREGLGARDVVSRGPGRRGHVEDPRDPSLLFRQSDTDLGVAFATSILLITFAWIGNARRSATFAELADLHVNALSSTNLVDVVSTDRHTVKPWFQGKIPFSFNLPEFKGTEYTLVGGRMVYFHQHPGAQLIVSMNQHKISVLIFQDSVELGRAFAEQTALDRRTSFGIEAWQSQQLRFVLVSDADPAGIDNLARLLKQANQ